MITTDIYIRTVIGYHCAPPAEMASWSAARKEAHCRASNPGVGGTFSGLGVIFIEDPIGAYNTVEQRCTFSDYIIGSACSGASVPAANACFRSPRRWPRFVSRRRLSSVW